MFEIPKVTVEMPRLAEAKATARVAFGLKMGRPDNRRACRRGDRRDMVKEPHLMGPDAHGVYWWPIRAYYDDEKDETLIVLEPVHPDQIMERLHDSA